MAAALEDVLVDEPSKVVEDDVGFVVDELEVEVGPITVVLPVTRAVNSYISNLLPAPQYS